jgi:hypothetical protein
MALSGLVIRAPYVWQILDGVKKWEIRGTRTRKRGRIALILAGSGTVVGFCDLVDVVGPLTLDELQRTRHLHLSEADELPYRRTFAWVMANPTSLPDPIRYRHPSGAVIWVSLPEAICQEVVEGDHRLPVK